MSKEEILRKNNYLDEDGFIDINAIHKSMEEYATQCQEDMALQIQELQTKIEDLTAENEQYERELNELTTKNK